LGWDIQVVRKAEEFRRRADECYRLSTQLKNPEHRSFALDLASAWTELAERAEAKRAAAELREAAAQPREAAAAQPREAAAAQPREAAAAEPREAVAREPREAAAAEPREAVVPQFDPPTR
jgi:hypothetical protein